MDVTDPIEDQDPPDDGEEGRPQTWWKRSWRWAVGNLNFYRVHVIYFTITPCIFAAVMFATSTGGFDIPYLDCLFCSMSAITCTGLATINLSTLTPFQQFLLFFQMIIGHPPVVSLVTIAVRRHFFRSAFRHAIKERQKRHSAFSFPKTLTRVGTIAPISALKKRFSTKDFDRPHKRTQSRMVGMDGHQAIFDVEMNRVSSQSPPKRITPPDSKSNGGLGFFHLGKKKPKMNISKGMIKRVEGGGMGLVNPMGWYDAERADTPNGDPTAPPDALSPIENGHTPSDERSAVTDSPEEISLASSSHAAGPEPSDGIDASPRLNIPTIVAPPSTSSAELDSKESGGDQSQEEADLPPDVPVAKQPYAGRHLADDAFPRSRTIAFDDADDGHDHDRSYTTARDGAFPRTATQRSAEGASSRLPRTGTTGTFPRTYSIKPSVSKKPDTRLSGFGGFPTPFEIIRNVADHVFPKATKNVTKTMSMPRTSTIGGPGTVDPTRGDSKEVPYISFAATVGRNSRFTGLTVEQMNELGGVEYRALKVLFWIIVCYVAALPLIGFIIIAPYISAKGRYDSVFDAQPRFVSIPWYALWAVESAFSNTGMSLVDKSLLPFQTAYVQTFALMILIFAGNTAYPIFLRTIVWCVWKLSHAKSQLSETLRFLLDHPRRCYIYMFPRTQTYVLALVILGLSLTDWVSFLVLDIGTPEIMRLPIGTRIACGFLQSSAVRSAGFAIVPLSALAPAVQVLYTIMMYISVFPIALSVRATNVYEEKSLGLYNEDEDEELSVETDDQGAHAVAKYLGWHARRQLAFDIWWLGFALWLICIIERGTLLDSNSSSWFTIFNIIFELVSGYGTVGLSIGVPYDNFSFSGSFRKLSKLVVVAVMLRGRHRGLPVAIDRAVMLPRDFTAAEEQVFEDRARRQTRRNSSGVPDDILANFRRGSVSNMSNSGGSRKASDPSSHPATPGPKFDASPNMATHTFGHHRADSTSSALRDPHSSGPGSPMALQFSLPRSSLDRTRGSSQTPQRHSHLSPVEESALSRMQSKATDSSD